MGHASLHSPARQAAPANGRVLGRTRAGIWVLLVLAAANGLFLYFFPGQADTDYAWSIKPPVNAAFIGAGFLAGTLATGLVLATATRWRTFSTLPIALWVLATHAARGDDHPPGPLQVATTRRRGCGRSSTPASRSPCRSSSRASGAVADPRAGGRPAAARPARAVGDRSAPALLAGAVALFVAPVELGSTGCGR